MSDESDRAAMMLPEGKTCGDCVHIHRCTIFGFTPAATETMCSFGPSRFCAKPAAEHTTDPRPTVPGLAYRTIRRLGLYADDHDHPDVKLVADVIRADRAASDAREDRLMEAVERIQSLGCDRINDGKRRACEQAGSMSRCASCIASRALAAIPPRSDR